MTDGSKMVYELALDEASKLVDQARASGSTSLSLSGLAVRELPPNLNDFSDLSDIDLSNCRELVRLQPLAALTSLQSLGLSGCQQLQDLQVLSALTSLQLLNLSHCQNLQDLQVLTTLTSLQSLHLSGCQRLQDLQMLAPSPTFNRST